MINIDNSQITEGELVRHGINELDTQIISKFILLLDKRINLSDSAYTTMGDSAWIKHFRQALSNHCDKRNYIDIQRVDA